MGLSLVTPGSPVPWAVSGAKKELTRGVEIPRNSEFCRVGDTRLQRAMPQPGSTQLRGLGHPQASPDTSQGPQGETCHAGSLDGANTREIPGRSGWALFTLPISS